MGKTTTLPISALTYKPAERMAILRTLSVPEQAAAFTKLSPYVQQSILTQLRTAEIVDLLDHLDLHQAERILAQIKRPKRRQAIVQRLHGELRDKLEYFLRFHPQATLSLINFNYLFLDVSSTIGEAATVIDEHYDETGKYPEVLVHEDGELLGEAPLAALVRERNNTRLGKLVTPLTTISYQSDVREVVDTLTAAGEKKVVVLDHDTSVLGIIYADKARSLFADLPAESLYDVAGVDDSERPFDSVQRKFYNRYKWLVLNLATSFLAGSVVLLFQGTLDEITILSVYIPIIAGMGSNAAMQTFAIMVRGITLGTISLKNAAPALWREVWAGLLIGLVIGTIVTLISAIWRGEVILGLVVGAALIGGHMVAAVAGTLVPLLMKQLGRDPAATSTIFITTITDVLGLMLLLGLATVILL